MTLNKNNPKPARLKRYLLTGILVTGPAFISLYAIAWLVKMTDRWVKSLIPARFYPDIQILGIPGMGLLLLLVLLVIIGFLTSSWVGKKCVSIADHAFSTMPLLSSMYSTLKKLFRTCFGDNTSAFRRVVLVEFPRRECLSLGFVTGTFAKDGNQEELLYVFVPTTPNPTSGYLVIVPESQVRDAEMTVEQGITAVVSMGIAN